jgi:hypothetical protein
MLQERPPSDNLEHWGMEMGPVTYLNPEAWGYMMVRGIKLRVRVYDAEAPADVTPVICGK